MEKFKQKWQNYELATGVSSKDDKVTVATLPTVIGDKAVDVYNTIRVIKMILGRSNLDTY